VNDDIGPDEQRPKPSRTENTRPPEPGRIPASPAPGKPPAQLCNPYAGPWQQARQQALDKAGRHCQCCGRGLNVCLIVHPIDHQGMTGPHALDPTNHRVLCAFCHRAEHRDYRAFLSL
jgi:hypothetical protein